MQQTLTADVTELDSGSRGWSDLLSAPTVTAGDGVVSTELDPFEVVWLRRTA